MIRYGRSIVYSFIHEEGKHTVLFSDSDKLWLLSGAITFFSEFYEPVKLNEGDSVYYDANMGHMLTSVSEEDALILWITVS